LKGKIETAVYVKDKTEREVRIKTLENELVAFLTSVEVGEEMIGAAKHFFDEEVDAVVHKNVLDLASDPMGARWTRCANCTARWGS